MNTNNSNIKAFLDFLQDYMFIIDFSGNIIEINEAVTLGLGYSKEDLLGKNIIEIHPEECRKEAAEVVQAMFEKRRSYCPLPVISKSGNIVPVETRVSPGRWNGEDVMIGLSRDLSALKHSQELLKHVFNLNHNLIVISTFENRDIIDVNEEFVRVLGYKREEVIGRNVWDLNLFSGGEYADRMIKLMKGKNQIRDMEIEFRSKDGRIFAGLFSLEKIVLQGREYLLSSTTNITELKQAQVRLKYMFDQQKMLADISQELNSPQDLSKSLDNVISVLGEHTGVSRVYLFEDNPDGLTTSNTFEWCNNGIAPQISELQNIPYELIPSWKPILMNNGLLFSEDIQELPGDLVAILAPQEIKSILIYPLYIKSRFSGFIGFDECMKMKKWVTEEMDVLRTVSNIISNVLERKLILSELKESGLRLQMALESSKQGLWDWNVATGGLYRNTAWASMLEYDIDELESDVSSWSTLVHPEDIVFVRDILDRHLKGETDSYESSYRIRTKSGKYRWILDHGMVIERDEQGSALRAIGLTIDITPQKESEIQLAELVATKDKFFSIISHDLKNPFTSLLGLSEMLLTDFDDFESHEVKSFIEEIFGVSKRTYNLLDNLLTWSRSQRGQIKLNPEVQPLVHIIDEIISLLGIQAAKKRISLYNEIPSDVSAKFDRETMVIVFRNLMTNAVKFTPVAGSVRIAAEKCEKSILVTISDTGVGMDAAVLDNLFRTGYQSSRPGTQDERGSGLGLILVKEFVEKNGGSINVSSTPGKGSSFSLKLPV